jgi:16S rRNA (cytosine967-C5)-methyltransferase
MNPSARYQATIELATEIATMPRPADALVSAYFRSRRYIGSKDRAAIATRLYDVLRHHARLKWWLKWAGLTTPTPRDTLLAYMVLVEVIEPREIDILFSGGKFAPAELIEDEKKLIRKLVTHTILHPNMPEEVQAECPDWAAPSLKQRFGKDFMHEMNELLSPAPLDLRINPLKTNRDDMLVAFKKLGLKVKAGRLSPYCIRVAERPSLADLPMLKDGSVEIQDEGSQLVAMMVDAQPGERVVDFCAGAGGKTLAIAAAMQNKGKIIACDVMGSRLKRSTERFRRAGLHNIEIKPLTSEADPWVKRHKGGFDRVLVDAPCTGTGTWRRNPDSRWHNLGPTVEQLIALQLAILSSAARLVKPGGRLVYATCSLMPEENEGQIDKFLEAHADFKLVPYRDILKDIPSTNDTMLSLTPARHHTDGFFAAALVRDKAKIPDQD